MKVEISLQGNLAFYEVVEGGDKLILQGNCIVW